MGDSDKEDNQDLRRWMHLETGRLAKLNSPKTTSSLYLSLIELVCGVWYIFLSLDNLSLPPRSTRFLDWLQIGMCWHNDLDIREFRES